jgi:hypothetical protein
MRHFKLSLYFFTVGGGNKVAATIIAAVVICLFVTRAFCSVQVLLVSCVHLR